MSRDDAQLAQLLQDLSRQRGDEQGRALAQSATLFQRLRARAGACARGVEHAPEAVSHDRALRELHQLIVRELARLCELAARSNDPAARLSTLGTALHRAERWRAGRLSASDLRELLAEELDCAQTFADLPAALLERVRALAARPSWGAVEHASFAGCAESLRCLPR